MAVTRKPPAKRDPGPRKRAESAVERRTTGRRTLRAVGPGDEPKVAQAGKPKTVAQAASDGTHLELLVALRTRIARTVEDPSCPPRDLASLSKRLADLGKEIEALKLAAIEEAADDEASATPDEKWDESAI